MCYRCLKPASTCICAAVPRVRNRIHIHIVQHVRERRHPIGTARIALLGLERVSLETVRPSAGAHRATGPFPPGTALLYPAAAAIPLETLPPGMRPSRLVVIDGTWHLASRILRDSPALRELPCVAFREERPSNYRIRREPTRGANATIEAIARALALLEPDTGGVGALLSSFDRMIDDQLRLATGSPRRVLREQRRPRTVPRLLATAGRDPVIACGESAPRCLPPKQRTLLTWNAVRLSTGQTFAALVDPLAPLTEGELRHMGLDAKCLESGLSREAFRDAWHHFTGPRDVLITWNKQPLGRLFDLTEPAADYLFLKAVYGSVRKRRCGTLSEVVEREGLAPVIPPTVAGFTRRAGVRLGQIEAVLKLLIESRFASEGADADG